MGIMEYGYRFGYTSAQVDLMVIDQPVISYKTDKKKSMMASRAEVNELDALTDAWEKKRKGKNFAGKKLNLNEFLNNGVKEES